MLDKILLKFINFSIDQLLVSITYFMRFTILSKFTKIFITNCHTYPLSNRSNTLKSPKFFYTQVSALPQLILGPMIHLLFTQTRLTFPRYFFSVNGMDKKTSFLKLHFCAFNITSSTIFFNP